MDNTFITSIYIDKVRHLENIEIVLDSNEKKHLILTGKNGSGKTTVLESIKSYLKSIEEKQYDYLLNNDKYIDMELKSVDRYKNSQGLSLIFNDDSVIQKRYDEGKFILAYFEARRSTNVEMPKGVEKVDLSDKYSMNYSPSKMFIKYLVDLKTQQAFARNENDMEIVNKIDNWFSLFEGALKELFNDDNLNIKFNYKDYNFSIYQTNREPFGFNELSHGYSAVLDIVMDLIMRMEKNKVRGYDLEGVVLIDEVETHLHIDLQKNIMPFLTKFFPKIQFIVTTHSPFVLSSLDDTVIYDLEKKIQVEDLSKYSYEGIVESYFNVDKYSREIKDKLHIYSELLEKNDRSDEDKEKMLELRLYFKTIPMDLAPELVYKFQEIELKRRGVGND
jgi:predicted ATPase